MKNNVKETEKKNQYITKHIADVEVLLTDNLERYIQFK